MTTRAAPTKVTSSAELIREYRRAVSQARVVWYERVGDLIGDHAPIPPLHLGAERRALVDGARVEMVLPQFRPVLETLLGTLRKKDACLDRASAELLIGALEAWS